MANDGSLTKVSIPWKDEVVGAFYFEKEKEAEAFGKDVIGFVDAVKQQVESARDAVYNKYKNIKPYRMFFKALEMKINGAVTEEKGTQQ